MDEYRVNVTPSADRDMDSIFAYIAEKLKVPGAALNLIERMYTALNSLSTMPKRHPLSRDRFLAKQGFRLLSVDHYLAFYVVDDVAKEVTVHRVMYAKRNYRKIFQDGEF